MERETRIQHLHALLVFLRPQGGGNHRLRLAAREQAGAVRARQDADFDVDLADLVERSAVRTASILQHLIAEDALFQAIEQRARFGATLFPAELYRFVVQFADFVIALELRILLGVHRVNQIVAKLLFNLRGQVFVDRARA